MHFIFFIWDKFTLYLVQIKHQIPNVGTALSKGTNWDEFSEQRHISTKA